MSAVYEPPESSEQILEQALQEVVDVLAAASRELTPTLDDRGLMLLLSPETDSRPGWCKEVLSR